MKYLVGSVAILLSTSLATTSCAQLPHAESVSGQKSTEGSVVIYDKQKERSCAIRPVVGSDTYRFGKGKTCDGLPNDEAYYFKLDGVPSAVLVTFYDDDDCDDDKSWHFRVRTLQNPTTLEPMKLREAHDRPNGSIIGPGVKMESKQGDNGHVDGHLSCVKIEY